jgi:imidazolonepropionase-like amidohydrolase
VNTVSEYIVKADSILTEKGFDTIKALHIKDGCIVDMDDMSVSDDSTELFDFTGYTVTPCFCDYHIHLFRKEPVNAGEISNALNKHGITTAFDGGSPDLYAMEIKDRVKNNLEIKSAGHAIYKKGSYGKYIGQGVETVREAEQLIDKMINDGADYIKIINSGIYHPDNNKISEGGFSLNDLRAIVNYANSKGLDVACHANGEKAVEDAVQSGVMYLIHGLYASDTSIQIMAKKGVAFIPTINAFASLKNISKSKESQHNIDSAVENHLKTVKNAFDKGVNVLLGSDAGPDFIPLGSSYHDEMLMLQKAGIPVESILSAAITCQLETGAPADFLVLDGLDVKKVFLKGKCIVDNT